MRNTTYKRRTARPLQSIVHLKTADTGERLCGLEYEAACPAPTVFSAGNTKPEVVKVSCPVCEAMAVLLEEARVLGVEEHFGVKSNNRPQMA